MLETIKWPRCQVDGTRLWTSETVREVQFAQCDCVDGRYGLVSALGLHKSSHLRFVGEYGQMLALWVPFLLGLQKSSTSLQTLPHQQNWSEPAKIWRRDQRNQRAESGVRKAANSHLFQVLYQALSQSKMQSANLKRWGRLHSCPVHPLLHVDLLGVWRWS